MSISFIGGGNMARAIIGGLRQRWPHMPIHVVDPNADNRETLARDFAVTTAAASDTQLAGSETIVLAVKPQVMPEALAQLRPQLGEESLLLSIAAGITLAGLHAGIQRSCAIVRAMPNTPALLGAGVTGLVADARTSEAQKQRCTDILSAVGTCFWFDDESRLDTVTALSGSGPAYFFRLTEAMAQAAEAQGLDADTARRMAVATALGAGRMLSESGDSPAELRRAVTSPGGTTEAALAQFENADLGAIVHHAMQAAAARAAALGSQYGVNQS